MTISSSSVSRPEVVPENPEPNLTVFKSKFFKVVEIGDKNIKAECNICKAKKKKKTISGAKNSTSNFLRHITSVHPTYLEEYEKEKSAHLLSKSKAKSSQSQFRLEKYFTPKNNADSSKPDTANPTRSRSRISSKEQNDLILRHIVTDLAPISSVLKPTFKGMFPLAKVHSDKKVVNRIQELHQMSCEAISNVFAKVSAICLTSDIWSASTRSFLGITAHFIEDDDLTRRSFALACERFEGEHNFKAIAEKLNKCCLSYGINLNQIVATVTDNGSNFVKAFKEFGIEPEILSVMDRKPDFDDDVVNLEDINFIRIENIVLDQENSEADNDAQLLSLSYHVRCCSHTLNLLATTDYKNMLELPENRNIKKLHNEWIKKAKMLWAAMKKSKSAEIIKKNLNASLKCPCETRWNSLYDSIVHLTSFDFYKINSLFTLALNKQQEKFSSEQWRYMTVYKNVMEPIATGVDILQGQNEIYFGEMLPTLHTIYTRIETLMYTSMDNMEKTIASAMLENLEKRFKPQLHLDLTHRITIKALVASISHPNYKLNWKFASTAAGSSNASRNLELKNVFVDACMEFTEAECDVNTSNQSDLPLTQPVAVASSFVLFNDDRRNPTNDPMKLEIDIFLQNPKQNFEYLKSLPNNHFLKRTFIQYNTILPSSAPVERMFNFSNILNQFQFNLKDCNFEKRVLLKINSKILDFLSFLQLQ